MAETRLKDLRKHLEAKQHTVFFPGQKQGECDSEYLVVRDGGLTQYQQTSSDMRLYEILAFVPKDMYSSLEVLIDQVKQDMKEVYPTFVSMHYETPPFYDDTVEAWMSSVQYRNMKQFRNN